MTYTPGEIVLYRLNSTKASWNRHTRTYTEKKLVYENRVKFVGYNEAKTRALIEIPLSPRPKSVPLDSISKLDGVSA